MASNSFLVHHTFKPGMAGKLILNSTQQSRSDQNMKQTHNIKAIILAAGVGSRIKPMSDKCPKNLLKINGVPILAG